MPEKKAKNRYPGVYKRGDSWYYVLSYVDGRGQRKQQWRVGGKTAAEANDARTAALNSRNSGLNINPEKVTFKEFARRWLESKQDTVAPNTYVSYQGALKRLEPQLSGVKLGALRAFHVQEAKDAMLAGGAAPSSVASTLGILRRALDDAVEWELVTRNVAARIRAPRQVRRQLEIPTKAQLQALFAAADAMSFRSGYAGPDYTMGPLVRLAVYTGMRVSELLALEWRDVDLEGRRLHVRQSKTSAGVRTFSMGPESVALLRSLREGKVVALGAGVLLLTRNQSKTGWIKVRAAAGLGALHFHDLRHTHVSLLIEQGVDFKTISERVGHTSIKTTIDLYGHLRAGSDAQAAAALEAALANI